MRNLGNKFQLYSPNHVSHFHIRILFIFSAIHCQTVNHCTSKLRTQVTITFSILPTMEFSCKKIQIIIEWNSGIISSMNLSTYGTQLLISVCEKTSNATEVFTFRETKAQVNSLSSLPEGTENHENILILLLNSS